MYDQSVQHVYDLQNVSFQNPTSPQSLLVNMESASQLLTFHDFGEGMLRPFLLDLAATIFSIVSTPKPSPWISLVARYTGSS